VAAGEISDELSGSTTAGHRRQVLDWEIASPEPADVALYVSGTATISGQESNAGLIPVEESATETHTGDASLFANSQGLDWTVEGGLLCIEWTMSPGDLSVEQLG